MMRITTYSDRLLDDLELLDWPDKVKAMQRNWIGRSTGAAVLFSVPAVGDIECSPRVLTRCSARPTWCSHRSTRWSTNWSPMPGPPEPMTGGPTAPPHPGGGRLGLPPFDRRKSDLERQENKTKTGVFLGGYCTNPVDGRQIPIFIADYVLVGYGTGAIMAVPGGDQRDWDFATEFGLPIVEVVAGGDISEAA